MSMFRELWGDFMETDEEGRLVRACGGVVVGVQGGAFIRDGQAAISLMRMFPVESPHLPGYHADTALCQMPLSAEYGMVPNPPLVVLGRLRNYAHKQILRWFRADERHPWSRGLAHRQKIAPEAGDLGGRFFFASDVPESEAYRTLCDEDQPDVVRRADLGEREGGEPATDYGVILRVKRAGSSLMSMFGSSSLGTYGCTVLATDAKRLDAWPLPEAAEELREPHALEIVVCTRAEWSGGFRLHPPDVMPVAVHWGPWSLDPSPGVRLEWRRGLFWRTDVVLHVPHKIGDDAPAACFVVSGPEGKRVLEVQVATNNAGKVLALLGRARKQGKGPLTYAELEVEAKKQVGHITDQQIRAATASLRRDFLSEAGLEDLMIIEHKQHLARVSLHPEVQVKWTDPEARAGRSTARAQPRSGPRARTATPAGGPGEQGTATGP